MNGRPTLADLTPPCLRNSARVAFTPRKGRNREVTRCGAFALRFDARTAA